MTRWIIARALAACCLVVFGCADSGPVAIDRDGPAVVTIHGVDLLVAPAGLAPAAVSTSLDVGPDGGSIHLGDASLHVPAGALDAPVTITMEGPMESLIAYRFWPSGLVFNAGATLQIRVDPGVLGIDDPTRIKIAGASDSGDDWQVIGGTWDEATGTVAWPIEHFSRYGLCVD